AQCVRCSTLSLVLSWSLLSVYSAGDAAAVHSFPTRRSSDLCVNVGCVPKKLLAYSAHYRDILQLATGFGWSIQSAKSRRSCRMRSEEHTSELQSRENLVCRLLLEKKNCNLRVGLAEPMKRTT